MIGVPAMSLESMMGTAIAASSLAQAAVPSSGRTLRSEAEERKAKLLKDLKEASEALEENKKESALVWDRSKRKWALTQVPSSSGPRDRGGGDADGGQDGDSRSKAGGAGEEEVKPCHLHPKKKPNKKCKFCQRVEGQAQAKAEQQAKIAAEQAAADSGPHGGAEAREAHKRTFGSGQC